MPPDEPAAPNPPDGLTIAYAIGASPSAPVTLEIVESATDEVIRRYSSADAPVPPIADRNIPDYWIMPPAVLSAAPGLHRFVWDLRYPPPPADRFTYPIAAVRGRTPQTPRGMLVMPGTYTVRLTIDGRVFRRAILVKMDPRVRATSADLALQFRVSRSLDAAMRRLADAQADVRRRIESSPADAARLQATLTSLQQALAPMPALFERVQQADARPTAAQEAAVADALARADAAIADSKR
jgi:hypothetical protein